MAARDTNPRYSFAGPDRKPCHANLAGCKVERVPGFSYCQTCRNALTKARKMRKLQGKEGGAHGGKKV